MSVKGLSQGTAFKFLEEICESVSKRGYISSSDQEQMRHIFGERADKALDIVLRKRVKKYVFKPSGIVRWVVAGIEEGDHLILPKANYCSCEDFFFQVLSQKTPACSHIIAQKLAEALNLYETFEDDDELYLALISSIEFLDV
jgi:predicted nucleic acid-binding Zn finger protein